MSKFQFVRIQDDGRSASLPPHKLFNTAGDAKCMAPTILSNRHGGGRIVLVEVQEVVISSANVRYEKF